jgi:hypothetical protein
MQSFSPFNRTSASDTARHIYTLCRQNHSGPLLYSPEPSGGTSHRIIIANALLKVHSIRKYTLDIRKDEEIIIILFLIQDFIVLPREV